MAVDPTRWPTPMHAWRHWMAMAERCEKTMYEIRQAYEAKMGRSAITDIEILKDRDFRMAVGDQQWARDNAMMYGMGAQMRFMEVMLKNQQQLLREIKELRAQPRYDSKEPPSDLSWIQPDE